MGIVSMDSMCILLHGTTLCSKDSCQSTLHLPVHFKKQTDVYYAILISVTIPYFLFFLVIYSSIFFFIFKKTLNFVKLIIYRNDYGGISLHGFI